MTRTQYPKQPRVGDVLEVHVGLVVVIAVHDRGRRLYVTDETGRVLTVTRADNGCWWRPEAHNVDPVPT
jgi:hypothetical protein